jgi:PAS domain S-box-containing protein
MNTGHSFIDRLVSPGKPRGLAVRLSAGLILPLAAVAMMHALFPGDESLFIPLLILAIVSASLFGGIGAGVLATIVSSLADVLGLRPWLPLRALDRHALFHIAMFMIAGVVISFVAGLVGSLHRSVEAERRRLAVTLSCIGDAVISTNILGQVVFMNPAAEKAAGWTSADASGKPPERMFGVVNQKTRTAVDNPIRVVLETGAAASLAGPTFLVRRDGTEIPIHDSAAPIRDAQGKMVGAVMVFRDISVEMEREAAWVQTQRLVSVGRLAATIAHEINNPLQSTSNLLFLIGRAEDLEIAQAHAVAAAHELRRATEITRQALTFVRGAGTRESLPVSVLFDDVMSLYRNKLKNKNIEVMRNYSPDTFVESRTGELRQVLGNLVGNALDALPVGGKLYLRAQPSAFAGRPAVSFAVADTGSGIAKDHMPRILEPFFTTKKDVGTGLGLWVVKKVVEGAGGTLRIRSRFGRGTVVRFDWPANQDREDYTPETPDAQTTKPDVRSVHVLAMPGTYLPASG